MLNSLSLSNLSFLSFLFECRHSLSFPTSTFVVAFEKNYRDCSQLVP